MSRFYSIRFRLAALFLGIILAVMVIISFFLYTTLERYYINNLTQTLERSGQIASDFVAGHLRGQVNSVRLSTLAENLSRQSQARIIFINQDAVVVGDSTRVGGLLNQVVEIDDAKSALGGRVSSSTVRSGEAAQPIMQVAVPVFETDGSVTGAVLLSTSLEELYKTMDDIRRLLFLATVLAMAIVGGGSVVLARRLTVPLEELTNAARKMAEGKLDQRIEFTSRDEIGRLAEQFNLMAKRLSFYTSNLKKFAADVAHEVRTPITTMGLITKALKEHEMEPGQQQEFIDDLDAEVERLTALVNDLLELSKLEKHSVEHEPLLLNTFIEEIVEEQRQRFKARAIDLTLDYPGEEMIAYAAPLRLRQVLVNLLDNALNYTGRSGKVSISLYREENEVVTVVEDSGCGIPGEDLPYIFERFFRVDRARSRDAGGTGLGLAIVSEIIGKHGGRVWVESEEGVGSRFFFSLPAVLE